MQSPVGNYSAATYMSAYGPPTWNQHPVSFPHPANPSAVEGSMVIMPAHPPHPTQHGLGLSPNAYQQAKLDTASPLGMSIELTE